MAPTTTTRRPRRRRPLQLGLGLPQHGGARPGAGRKRRGPRPRVSHRTRPRLGAGSPVHVTLRLIAGLPSLRDSRTYAALKECLAAGRLKRGFRLVEHSIQTNHIHLIVEADAAARLSRGIQGLAVRLARRLNRLLGRRGKVFDDRYHGNPLRAPRQVRAALLYVLNNRRRHAAQGGLRLPSGWLDPFSSAPSFDGWADAPLAPGLTTAARADARGWLLTAGWRARGLLAIDAVPGG
jgi:REP element-mobilizing transposase RayT